jgi:predicted membrane protein
MTPKGTLEVREGWRARIREPALTVLLVVELVIVFVFIPLNGIAVYQLESAHLPIVALLALGSVAAVARGRVALLLTFLAAAIAVSADFFRYESPSAFSSSTFLYAVLAFLLIMTGVVAHVVFGPGRVTAHRIRGAIVLYLHLALIFTFLYAIVLFYAPDAFGQALATTDASVGGKLLYFSFTTLTTVGYGDIVPVHPFARSLANLEAIIGQLYPATLLARVVTLQITARDK